MARHDDLGREVNRLYWDTDEPVTRMAVRLDVSRGTFYNHLRPKPAGSICPTCGARMLYRNRSSRDAGEAHCGECASGTEIKDSRETKSSRAMAASGSAAESTATRATPGSPSKPPRSTSGSAASDELGREAALLASRLPDLEAARLHEVYDAHRTQLLIAAVGAAALGLGLLYYSRRS